MVIESDAEQIPLFFKLCSDHLSVEAIPRKSIRIELWRLKEHTLSGHELMLWTPHFAVLRNAHGQEITLRRNGRMIVRKAGSEEVARRAVNDVMNLIRSTSQSTLDCKDSGTL
jgi:hypothetical protein